MKTKTIAVLAALSLFPLAGFSQNPTPPTPPVPPNAPVPPVPPVPPNHRGDRDRLPKVPVTFLGVETSEVPSVVAEQLGLAKGFGLVVDYVVPDGPAAAAGLQANDILKMFNDQILTEPDQLSKLVRSNAEGATVTLTVLRKGAETKLTAKLAKREVPQRPGMDRRGRHGENFGDMRIEMEGMGEQLREQLREQLGNAQFGVIGDAVSRAREEAQRVREEMQRSREEMRRSVEEGKRAMEEGKRAAEEGRRAAREVRVTSQDNGSMKTTRIDLGKAQIVYNDAQGEMKIETVDNKKVLTAKDPQGRLLFSGPVSTKEELDKVPAEVRQRYDKLEQKDLPTLSPRMTMEDNDADDDDDEDEADEDNDSDDESADVLQVIDRAAPSFPSRHLGITTVLI